MEASTGRCYIFITSNPIIYMWGRGVLYISPRRGLAALLILEGGQCESLGTGVSKGTDSHVFFIFRRLWGRLSAQLKIIMKKVIFFTLVTALLCSCHTSSSISQNSAQKRSELVKMTSAEVSRKATKTARDEAKRLKKEGWTVAPGALPLDKQLDRAYMMQYEFDENLYPKYLIGEAMSIGSNYDGAKMQALELAKQNLAGNIQTEIAALTENKLANKQLGNDEAATITQSVAASKSYISQSLGRTLIVTEAYRTLPNKNKEVLVRIAYNFEMAMETAQKAIKKDLEEKGEELHKELDAIFSHKLKSSSGEMIVFKCACTGFKVNAENIAGKYTCGKSIHKIMLAGNVKTYSTHKFTFFNNVRIAIALFIKREII